MKPNLKYIFLTIAVLVIFGIYLANKPHRNVSRSEPEYFIDAKSLFTAFEEYEEKADAKFLDRVIQVTGVVREVVQDDDGNVRVTLDTGNDFFGIVCELQSSSHWTKADFKAGQEVTFKGLCTGMSMDVVLVRCVRVS
ncbi:MAG: hypothetical protein H6563_07655 [Lewinellaceae bacterium]|nr:hypothetical protein [Lewinellaceae bacterium]